MKRTTFTTTLGGSLVISGLLFFSPLSLIAQDVPQDQQGHVVTAHLGESSTEQREVEKSAARAKAQGLCGSLPYRLPSSSPARHGVVGVRW
jgi:hypothetical protein